MSMRMPRRENLPAAGRLHYCGLPRPQGDLIGLKAGRRVRIDNQERDTRNQIFMHFFFTPFPAFQVSWIISSAIKAALLTEAAGI
ncbi:hypothetical protein [Microbulbifer rhizosphaerae]|uniref:Uncharacterized protein n=1 Tax=Microbulbifer rhizosphaerae TaxID=1562603 RepID=A0A7W4WEU5_9GAMM|nr:hypothetical protein [Microbulbifer rhizosphaerae]MBB3062256.1 hypothetical protein [Microbulbifer rhizosphaerae]